MINASDAPLLATLAVVARRGSFSAAADELKLSRSVISDRIAELERRCGARLLERTTRRVRLTEAGASAFETAARIEDTLALLARSLEERHREPSGVLRVSTTVDLGPSLVGPTVARLVASYPKVRAEILTEDTCRDLIEGRIDVAVRLGTPKSSSFVARKLAVLREPIVAAPALADTLLHTARPQDLAAAPWVRHSLVTGATMKFVETGGASQAIQPDFRAEANSGATVVSLLLAGAGVGVMPEHVLWEHLRDGRLVRLCPGWIWRRVTLYALTPSRSSRNTAATAFVSLLRDQMNQDGARWASIA